MVAVSMAPMRRWHSFFGMANFIRIAIAEMLLKRRMRWQTLFQIDTPVWSDPAGRFHLR
jgi:hypothetical protein